MSCSAEEVVWVSIHDDAELKTNFLAFARESSLGTYPFARNGVWSNTLRGRLRALGS